MTLSNGQLQIITRIMNPFSKQKCTKVMFNGIPKFGGWGGVGGGGGGGGGG